MSAPSGGAAAADLRAARGPRLRAQLRFAAVVVSLITAVSLWLGSGLAIPHVIFVAGPFPVIIALVATALYASVGLIISVRRPEARMGRILAWVAIIQCLRDLAWAYDAFASPGVVGLPLDREAVVWFNYLTTLPVVATLIITLTLVFPTDRPLTPRWWRVTWAAAAGAALIAVGGLIRPGPVAFAPEYENPIAPLGLLVPAAVLQYSGYALLALAAAVAALGVVRRYRRSDLVSRAQLRIFVASSIFLAGTFVLLLSTSLLGMGTLAMRDLIATAFFTGTALLPIAVLVAVARYRLFAIDQLVGRGFVYGALLAILAGLYAASIRLFTALFTSLTGESSDASLVVTTLILATTFTPIKTRLERVVARSTGASPEPDDPELVALIDERVRLAMLSSASPTPSAQSGNAERPATDA